VIEDSKHASDRSRPSGPRVRTTVAIPIRHGIRARFVSFDGLADQREHFVSSSACCAIAGPAAVQVMRDERLVFGGFIQPIAVPQRLLHVRKTR
jgi:hypothetical protein